MERDDAYLTKQDLNSLFEKSVRLLGPTWKNSLLTLAAVWVPLSVLSLLFLRSILGGPMRSLLGTAAGQQSPGSFLALYGYFGLYGLIYGIATMAAGAIVLRNAWAAASGGTPAWNLVVSDTLRQKFGKIVALLFLEILAFVAFFLAVALVAALSAAIAAALDAKVAGEILVVVLTLASMAAALLLLFCLSFALPSLAVEDIGPGRAIAASFRLLRGSFWRALGLSVLFSLALSIALSIITLPLYLTGEAPLISELSKLAEPEADAASVLSAMTGTLGPGFALYLLARGILQGMIAPLFTLLLYADLKIREGERKEAIAASEPPEGAGPGEEPTDVNAGEGGSSPDDGGER